MFFPTSKSANKAKSAILWLSNASISRLANVESASVFITVMFHLFILVSL